ncbi:MAG: bifunctional metallophosphatase/5'-nucleotidase [Acidobacteria bacterium]|nr:MAG: bifunctional metallophosphatase/5'-nucleotidase [Acidobacteriota bacterium]REK16160.1 MAG: bifunctional metallophosphatase/5'-nucleotidase [Acidobacteriota bacterium]REK43841.1 MAG: bifunctional metallophosphatase/5'-nucleotidase [Acidobacteriota bacterium]
MISATRLLFTTFCLTVLAFSSFAQTDPEAPIRVTFLHVNDVYQFMPVEGGKRGGHARLLTIRKQAEAENAHVLFTLGGDTLSPSVETRTYKGAQMIDAWNAIGLDYSVLGNHEFDISTEELLKRIEESEFTWLGANVIEAESGKPFADLPEFVIREFEGVKIGIIGLLLPETKETSSMDDSLKVTDYCLAANLIVSRLRKVEKVDAVVGLTHLFMEQDKKAAGCADFDLILGGHEHSLLQSSANGTPIFKMTADAREVGKFNLNFDRQTKRLTGIDWEIIPVTDEIPDDPEFAPIVAKYKDLLDRLSVPVGATSVTLNALSVANRTNETNIGNFIADAYREAVDADIGFVNGGSIRADLTYNPGPLTKRDVLSMLPFNNPIVKVEVTGAVLKEIVEHGVARSAEDSEPGRFPQISGMTFRFDASRPARNRVIELKVAGQDVVANKTYTIATSDFLVSRGGDGYTMFARGNVVSGAEGAPRDSEVFEDAIKSAPNATISPKLENRIVREN